MMDGTRDLTEMVTGVNTECTSAPLLTDHRSEEFRCCVPSKGRCQEASSFPKISESISVWTRSFLQNQIRIG